ncbi:hypothetical protein GQ457_06G016710 [Hibiscus cannabinus]
MPPRFGRAATRESYNTIVATKSKWEEQGFFLDDRLENYGLEPIIYKRLNDLDWLRFGRQPARANLNWVMEFYANNADGDDTVTVRGMKVHANSATINNILDLPNDSPSIYELINILEDEDLDTIKDQLCEQGTEWNVKGKNPKTISRPHLQPEAELWNTFVKRNLMPTSHNQTVDRTRLVLINAIVTGQKFNVGEVIGRELSAACQNEKGILAFHCIISALCRRATVPATQQTSIPWKGLAVVGRVRKVDNSTHAVDCGKFARLAIVMDLSKPLKSCIKIDNFVQKLEYEGLTHICFGCGVYGHLKVKCGVDGTAKKRWRLMSNRRQASAGSSAKADGRTNAEGKSGSQFLTLTPIEEQENHVVAKEERLVMDVDTIGMKRGNVMVEIASTKSIGAAKPVHKNAAYMASNLDKKSKQKPDMAVHTVIHKVGPHQALSVVEASFIA